MRGALHPLDVAARVQALSVRLLLTATVPARSEGLDQGLPRPPSAAQGS